MVSFVLILLQLDFSHIDKYFSFVAQSFKNMELKWMNLQLYGE